MIENKLKNIYLKDFNYEKTIWYKKIKSEYDSYSLELIIYPIIIALFVIISLMLIEFINFKSINLIKYTIPFLFLFCSFIYLKKTKKTDTIVTLSLLFISFLFFYCLFFQTYTNVYKIVFFIFPILSLKLTNIKKGSVFFFSFIALVILTFILGGDILLPKLNIENYSFQIFNSLVTALLIYILTLFGEKQHNKIIDRVLKNQIYDDITNLPNRDVLLNSINLNKNYILAIVRIENYGDLVGLFGYELSDCVSHFASKQFIKYENTFNYKTYQLKYNEYALLIDIENEMINEKSAKLLLSEVMNSIDKITMPWENNAIRLVYRTGAVIVKSWNTSNILSKADIALKTGIKNHESITIYKKHDKELQSSYDSIMRFSLLYSNKEDCTFQAVFQPIFNTDDKTIAWYESLLRIKNKNGIYESIYPYLSIAQSTGMYHFITEFMLEKASDAIILLDVDVSVNISISDIVRCDFLTSVLKIYEKIKHKTGRIIFEILESEELTEIDCCIDFIKTVSKYGFKIAIDDFGSGYANFTNLLLLPIDIVKIDGSLIKRLNKDVNAKILVEGIASFCKQSNKKIVAEFIEDEELHNTVKELKIDFSQGYYLGKPESMSV